VKTVANQNLKDTVLQMDEHCFVNCTISECTLLFSGGDFGLVDCEVVNCEIRFAGAARNTIQFLKRLTAGFQTLQAEITSESKLVH